MQCSSHDMISMTYRREQSGDMLCFMSLQTFLKEELCERLHEVLGSTGKQSLLFIIAGGEKGPTGYLHHKR